MLLRRLRICLYNFWWDAIDGKECRRLSRRLNKINRSIQFNGYKLPYTVNQSHISRSFLKR